MKPNIEISIHKKPHVPPYLVTKINGEYAPLQKASNVLTGGRCVNLGVFSLSTSEFFSPSKDGIGDFQEVWFRQTIDLDLMSVCDVVAEIDDRVRRVNRKQVGEDTKRIMTNLANRGYRDMVSAIEELQ